jgi:hypothetical protein
VVEGIRIKSQAGGNKFLSIRLAASHVPMAVLCEEKLNFERSHTFAHGWYMLYYIPIIVAIGIKARSLSLENGPLLVD